MSASPNRVLAVIVAVAAVLAVIAGVVAANRSAPVLDPETPDGIVLMYLRALLERDNETAADLLSASSDCDADDIGAAYVPDSARLVLVETSEDGDAARVTVEITESGSGPFGGDGYSHEEFFTLERTAGEWRITGEPWPMYFCQEG